MSDGPHMPDPGAEPLADDLTWHRLHPVTPLLRSWAVLAAFLVVIARELGGAGPEDSRGFVWSYAPWVAAAIAAVVLVSAAGLWWSWRRRSYAYDSENLYVRSGIFSRSHRTVRLDRVQSITVVQPLAARIFGFAQLTFEVAGGAGSSVELGFLRDDAATALRTELLARAAGLVIDESHAAPQAPERVVLSVTPGTAWGATLLSSGTLIGLAVIVGSVVVAIATQSAGLLVTMALGIFSVLRSIVIRFGSTFGFVAALSPDGIRLRRGLLTATAQTVPPGRVQAVQISQPLLWRIAGWWQVRVNVAGTASADSAGDDLGDSVLFPAGTLDQACTALSLVLPDLARQRDVLIAGLTGKSTVPDDPYVSAPRRARLVDPLAWQRHGYLATTTALLLRSGRWSRSLVVVPHERTQSLGVRQGPVQRWLGVASFVLHSTPGPVEPRLDHADCEVIAALVAEQSDRARRARSAAGPEAWMRTSPRLIRGAQA